MRGDHWTGFPKSTIEWLADELEARTDPVRVEIELWSYQSTDRQQQSSVRFEQAVRAVGGEFLHRASIPEIAYEAALVNLPAAEVLRLQQRDQSPLTVCDDVMLVRPQSTAQFPTAVDTLGAATGAVAFVDDGHMQCHCCPTFSAPQHHLRARGARWRGWHEQLQL